MFLEEALFSHRSQQQRASENNFACNISDFCLTGNELLPFFIAFKSPTVNVDFVSCVQRAVVSVLTCLVMLLFHAIFVVKCGLFSGKMFESQTIFLHTAALFSVHAQ